MNYADRKLYYIPPSWMFVILFAIVACLYGLFIKYDVQSALAIYAYFNKPALFLSCALAILSTTSYSFYPDRLEVRILLFTRRVYWKDVTGAIYFESLTHKSNAKRKQAYLIICVSPCQPVEPSSVNFASFDRKNLRHLVRIPISKIEKEIFGVMENLRIKVYAD